MTRKPVPVKSVAAAASTRAKAVAKPVKAARTTPTSAPETSRFVPAKKAAAKTAAPKAASKPAVKAAVKAPPKRAVKVAATAAKAAPKPVAKAVKPVARVVARAAAVKPPAPGVKSAARALVKAAKEASAAGRVRAIPAAPAADARPTLVRDSFTMPDGEYAVLANVKQACLKAGFEIKKSELLRIGVALVGRLDIASLRQVLDGLPQLKTGRPPGQ